VATGGIDEGHAATLQRGFSASFDSQFNALERASTHSTVVAKSTAKPDTDTSFERECLELLFGILAGSGLSVTRLRKVSEELPSNLRVSRRVWNGYGARCRSHALAPSARVREERATTSLAGQWSRFVGGFYRPPRRSARRSARRPGSEFGISGEDRGGQEGRGSVCLSRDRIVQHRLSPKVQRIHHLRVALSLLRTLERNARQSEEFRWYQFATDGSIPESQKSEFVEEMRTASDQTFFLADSILFRSARTCKQGERSVPMTMAIFLREGRRLLPITRDNSIPKTTTRQRTRLNRLERVPEDGNPPWASPTRC
jgi:hypothetical protein